MDDLLAWLGPAADALPDADALPGADALPDGGTLPDLPAGRLAHASGGGEFSPWTLLAALLWAIGLVAWHVLK